MSSVSERAGPQARRDRRCPRSRYRLRNALPGAIAVTILLLGAVGHGPAVPVDVRDLDAERHDRLRPAADLAARSR